MTQIYEATHAIEIEHLVKRFPRGRSNAVDDISFTVRRGEIFGLLGPNGAGKSTTIGILTTTILPTGGRVTIEGTNVVTDPIGAKRRIGIVPQRNNLDRSLRVGEILTFHAAYHGVPHAERSARAQTLLAEFGLEERGKDKIGWFSGGMEQRVLVARALMHSPPVLFLDEPTNNLDPQSRRFLWERIRTLNDQGTTIVLTTHDMEEADKLCDRIAIMDRGRILALDTPEGLKNLIPGGTMLDLKLGFPGQAAYMEGLNPEDNEFRKRLENLPGVIRVEHLVEQGGREETVYRLYTNSNAGTLLAKAVQAVQQTGAELLDLRLTRPSLEDVFIHLTGRNLRV